MSEEETLYSTFLAISNEELAAILSKVPSPRRAAFSEGLFGLFARLIPAKTLESFGAPLALESLGADAPAGALCCFCLDDADAVALACRQLAHLPERERLLIVAPRVTALCQEAVERAGLRAPVLEWHADVAPLEPYFFAVPAPRCFGRCFVDGDISDVFSIGRALTKLQLIHGAPARVFAAGEMAARVRALLAQQRLQIGADFLPPGRQFDDLFIVDRAVDLATPLLTQFTYGGQIDDRFEGRFGRVRIPESCGCALLELSDADEIFAAARALPMAQAPQFVLDLLAEIASIRAKMDGASGTNQWNAHARRAERLSQLKPMLEVHLNLLALLTALTPLDSAALAFELAAVMQAAPDRALLTRLLAADRVLDAVRLLCLDSVTTGGVKAAALRDFQRRLVNRFGARAAGDLRRLERAGLLASGALLSLPFGGRSFAAVRDRFRLVVDGTLRKRGPDGEDAGPADVGAGYGNYVPLIARLVRAGIDGAWAPGGDADAALTQMGIPHSVTVDDAGACDGDARAQRRVLVFVVGGVTETEVQVIRQMGAVFFDGKVDFHIGSTSVISGKKLLRELCPVIAGAQ
jgi:hypothetical protein